LNERLPVLLAVALALAPLATAEHGQTAQRPSAGHPPIAAPAKTERRVPFRVGEQLSYNISWSSFVTATAATATVTVREKKPAYGSVAYYIVAEGRPTPVVAIFYSLYYKVDTWLDAYTLLPLRASEYSQERGLRQNKVTLFDQARGRARFEVQSTTTNPAGSGLPFDSAQGRQAGTVQLPPQTQDPLSAIFALRASPMKAGTRTLMPVTFNGSVYQVQVTIDGRESLETAVGRLQAWRITPVMLESGGEVASPRGMTLWISDDARRLPLKMQVELPAGRFDLTLKEVNSGTPAGR
jgi:hypothetical protein